MADKRWNIHVDASSATTAAGHLGKMDKSIAGIAKSAAGLAAGYFGAAGMIRAVKFSIEQSAEAESAARKLSIAYGKNTDALVKFAGARMRATRFDDDATVAAMASIAAFAKEEKQIKALTVAAQDMAEAKGIDLVSAADLVGKAFVGSGGAISRYGVAVDGAAGSSERLESITKGIADLWGGQAAAAAETLSGRIDQAKNSVGNAAQEIGDVLSPVVRDLAEDLADMAGTWQTLIDEWASTGKAASTPEGILISLSAQVDAARSAAQAAGRTIKDVHFGDMVRSENAEDIAKYAKHLREIGSPSLADRFTTLSLALEAEAAQVVAMLAPVNALAAAHVNLGGGATAAAREVSGIVMAMLGQLNTARWEAGKPITVGPASGMGDLEKGEAAREVARAIDEQAAAWDKETLAKMKSIEADRLKRDTFRAGLMPMLSGMIQLNAAAKGNALLTKRLGQGEAIINTAQAATAALKTPPGPPWTIPMFLATLAMGAAQVATIQAQQFASGGWVDGHGGSRSDSVPARLSSGERVLSAREIALMGGRGAVDAIARGGGGGGITINFSGPITDRQYVQDYLVPEIKRAVRLSA